jgi:hypothetical protein
VGKVFRRINQLGLFFFLEAVTMSKSRSYGTILAAGFIAVAMVSVHSQPAFAQAAPAAPVRYIPQAADFNDHTGYKQIFDGKSLAGWDGPSDVWSYEDGAIVGKSPANNPSGTTNIIYKGAQYSNFRLKLEMKLEGAGANGGVQYRSKIAPPHDRPVPADATPEVKARMEQAKAQMTKHAAWNLEGYQFDFDSGNRYTGQMYEQGTPRGIIAYRGMAVTTLPNQKPVVTASLGSMDELKAFIKPGEWNQVEIIAEGHVLTHILNGHVMSILIDEDPAYYAASGVIAFEIEGGGDVKISHRNIWIKPLP